MENINTHTITFPDKFEILKKKGASNLKYFEGNLDLHDNIDKRWKHRTENQIGFNFT